MASFFNEIFNGFVILFGSIYYIIPQEEGDSIYEHFKSDDIIVSDFL